MNRDLLNRYKQNKRELELIDAALARLEAQLDGVAIVPGKVTKSSDDFPYIEEHVSVEMPEPMDASRIREKMAAKEQRRSEIAREMRQVEEYIEGMPDGIDKQIFEMVYLDGMTQTEAGESVGYTQGRVSQIIKCWIKD